MREILFKAKEIDTGDWVYGYLVRIHEDDYRIVTEYDLRYAYTDGYDYDGTMTKIDKNTICQYTGLKDKDGNKIWENDCIGHRLNTVEFLNGEWCVNGDSPLFCFTNNCEVIGNIFDHPELLKGVRNE